MDNEKQGTDEHTKSTKEAPKKGDPGTLNTTDPQDHMEGPLSSLMHNVADSFDDDQTAEEARKKEENK